MIFELVMGLLGGLGLFIYGMHLMSDSLQKLSLNTLKLLLEKSTSNRFKAFLVGTGITALIQSSSATSVITIGLLNAGLITLKRAIPIVFGANIGTTITAQLIAFKLTKIAPIFIAIGVGIYMFCNNGRYKKAGLALTGFGMLFMGLNLMSSAVKPMAGNEAFSSIFIALSQHPLLGILAGLLITIIFQSSSTTIGMVIAIAATGLIDLRAAIFLVLGDNIGTCITAIIASIGGKRVGKRLAAAHSLFNIIGSLIALALVPIYLYLIPMTSSDITRQIANVHTAFNIFNALIFLPALPLFKWLTEKIIKGKDYERKATKHLAQGLIKTPSLAIGAAVKEMGEMALICKELLLKLKEITTKFNYKAYKEIKVDEESVDELQVKITEYLVKVTKHELNSKQSRLITDLIHTVNDLEKIGDHGEHIADLLKKKREEKHKFSDPLRKEINLLITMTIKQIDLTKRAMINNDHKSAYKSLDLAGDIEDALSEFDKKDLKRQKKEQSSWQTGLIYSDILIHIESISSHLCNINESILDIRKKV